MWALDRSEPLRMFVNHQEPLTDVKYHPNCTTLATASYDRTVMIWDVRCNENRSPFCKMFADSVEIPRVMQFTRNGRVLIVGDEGGKISPWDIGEGRKIGSVRAHEEGVRDMTISVEGTLLASAGVGGDVMLWDMGTLCSASASGAEALRKFQPRKARTHRVVFSSRNLLYAIGTSLTPQT
jgi:WD40 repeat protein